MSGSNLHVPNSVCPPDEAAGGLHIPECKAAELASTVEVVLGGSWKWGVMRVKFVPVMRLVDS